MSALQVWIIILAIGIGTFAMRLSFLGLIGRRPLPDWVERHLRYTAVAVLPGLVAPLVIWPAATGGALDPARMSAAAVALLLGWWRKSVLAAMIGGFAVLYPMLWLTGQL